MQNNLPLKSKSTINLHQVRIATYVRVSTTKQSENTSEPTQLKYINSYIALQKDWYNPIIIPYSDEQSASRNPKKNNANEDLKRLPPSALTRPGLRQLLFDAHLNKFDFVLCYSHDRLTRNTQEALIINHTLRKLGIKLIYCRPGENINSENDAMNKFFENLLNNLSALESNIIGARVKLANTYKINNNFWAGGPAPFGYKLIKDIEDKKKSVLTIDYHAARLVITIFELYNLGYSANNILSKLKSEGKLTKDRIWSINTIKGIITNPVYQGKLVWNKRGGVRNAIRHSSNSFIESKVNEKNIIIPSEKFLESENLRKKLTHNSKFLSTSFLLQDLIYCGKCGEKLSTKNHGNNKRFYYCNERYPPEKDKILGKRHISIANLKIENVVISTLEEIITSALKIDTIFETFYSKYNAKYTELLQDTEKHINTLKENLQINENLLQTCVNQLDELEKLPCTDSNDKSIKVKNTAIIESLIEFKILIETNISSITKNIKDADITNKLSLYSKDKLRETFKNERIKLLNILQESDVNIRNRALRLLFNKIIYKVILEEDKSISIIFK